MPHVLGMLYLVYISTMFDGEALHETNRAGVFGSGFGKVFGRFLVVYLLENNASFACKIKVFERF